MPLRRRLKYQAAWALAVLLYAFVQGSTIPTISSSTTTIRSESTSNRVKLEKEELKTTPASRAVLSTTPVPASANSTISGNGTDVPTEKCTPPAIEQFPRPIIGPSARKHGALVFHLIICIYSFIGLAIVCDEYFVTSLDRICEVFQLTPDVAGATFMAAGSSAPELATVVIGVFFAKDDIGVSGVIGSAVFNIMFVIAICAIFGGTVAHLNWYPLCRDSFFYLVSIIVMLIVIFDDVITWVESIFMLVMYAVYCVFLCYNKELEAWAQTLPIPCKALPQENEDQHLVSYKNLEEKEGYNATQQQGGQQPGPATAVPNGGSGGQPPPVPPPPQPPKPEYYKPKEPTNQVSPLVRPETQDQIILLQWRLCYPIHYTAQKTMPDCKSEQYRNWYPFTFLMSMVWISFYSYIMVWMITVVGSTLGIPDTVMGLTFVAAGVSVPDALSSLAVIKEGYGDMAVSNAVGSNVFDILVCLGLPWFMKTAVVKPGSIVRVYSKGLTYSTLTLLSTVVFLVGVTHMNGWKMDKRYGIILLLWYVLFICFASLYELNVFGKMNPPECGTIY